jgi:flagellar basal-body rod protein FlgF
VNSGIYTGYSGLQAQMDALDLVSNNLANLNTNGFKESKAFFTLLNQNLNSQDSGDLNSTVNNQVILAGGALNFSDGSLLQTNRDLDVALTGNGFLTVQAPQGIRYTRNGSLLVNGKSVLTTAEGFPVLGEKGKPITLGPGKVSINESGEVSLEGARLNLLKIVSFDNPAVLEREGGSLLRAPDGVKEKAGQARVRQGYLEQSNANPISTVIGLVGIMRQFESIQKSVNLLMNDLNSKSIERLSR